MDGSDAPPDRPSGSSQSPDSATAGRRLRNRVLVVLGVIIALGVARATFMPGSIAHRDGEGPLGSNGTIVGELAAVPMEIGTFTFGVRLCAMDPSRPAVLQKVSPRATVGSGYEAIGLGVRRFVPSPNHTSIISILGFPPPTAIIPDRLEPVAGFVVTTSCANGPYDATTELLVGFASHGTNGGGWRGIEIAYLVNGRPGILQLDHDLLVCGDSIASVCSQPGASPSTIGASAAGTPALPN